MSIWKCRRLKHKSNKLICYPVLDPEHKLAEHLFTVSDQKRRQILTKCRLSEHILVKGHDTQKLGSLQKKESVLNAEQERLKLTCSHTIRLLIREEYL